MQSGSVGSLVDELRPHLGERLLTAPSKCTPYGQGESFDEVWPPDAVALVRDANEVSTILEAAARLRVPVIPRGAGTSLEGHVAAPLGGVTIDLSGMNRILEVNEQDLDCTVEPGVTREQLNRELRHSGLFFPVDPGADATLGGMVATRASGTNAVRYGTLAENVLALTVVLPGGRSVRVGSRARKSAAGYDLKRLFTGAEGTLGVITAVTLRLHGRPEQIASAVCAFPSLKQAVETVAAVMQAGIPVARVELLDETQIRACNEYSHLGLPECATLFFEFHGTQGSVAEQSRCVEEFAAALGGSSFNWSIHEEDRNRLWKARHQAYFAALALRPGAAALVTDVCVPHSRLVECIVAAREDIKRMGLTATLLGHVGDGNFHAIVLHDAGDAAERQRVAELNRLLVRRALAAGGTCTGEHGIGLGKRDHLLEECGAEVVDLMRRVKAAIDPHGIMNPAKIFRP